MRRHLVLVFALAAVCGLEAADRSEITFDGPRIFPESLTSTKNGDIYFGSLGQDSVYRATANESRAKTWIQPKSNGLSTVLGVLADENAGVLWVCASASGGRNGAPYVGETALKAFNLKGASLWASYAFPGNGLCNDIAVARDGTVYATDTTRGRVLRPGVPRSALDVWSSDQPRVDAVSTWMMRSPSRTPAFSAGVCGKTRCTVTNPSTSPISIPTPPYLPPVCALKVASSLGERSTE